MDFRRINDLPPYVFAIIDQLKMRGAAGRRRRDRPRHRQPRRPVADIAVDKLAEAARNPRNHRYSAIRGIPNLRAGRRRPVPAALRRRARPRHARSIATIGAKEGFSHLVLVLLEPGDAALVPVPSIRSTSTLRSSRGPRCGTCRSGRSRTSSRTCSRRGEEPRGPDSRDADRPLVPAQPDHRLRRPRRSCSASSTSRASTTRCSFTTSRTPTSRFDGYQPPSILEVPGAKDVAVELFSMSKSYSMAGWRVGFCVGNAEVMRGARPAQELPRLRHVPADPDRRDRRAERAPRTTRKSQRDLPGRRDALIDGLGPAGWKIDEPKGRCSSGRPSPSRYARAGLARVRQAAHPARRRWRCRRASASARAARATCASRSSRTSTASARPSAGIRKRALTRLG